jgi:hypothetical protein
MPGASILPVAFHNNKLYFLFGKENPLEDSAVGYSDFGGGVESGESPLDAATREGSEELSGFLGTSQQLKTRLRKTGVYKIKYAFQGTAESEGRSKSANSRERSSPGIENKNTYTIHIFPMSYDLEFVKYFNDNHAFLWNRMNKQMLNKSKLFEKIKVDWFCEDELQSRMAEYRPFYRDIVKTILAETGKIRAFVKSGTQTQTRRRKISKNRIFSKSQGFTDSEGRSKLTKSKRGSTQRGGQ